MWFVNHWVQLPFLSEWSAVSIMAKELVPKVVSCALWRPLHHKNVEFCWDNQGLVAAINKGSSKEKNSDAPHQVFMVLHSNIRQQHT